VCIWDHCGRCKFSVGLKRYVSITSWALLLVNVQSGTGDLRKVLDGGARKNSRNTIVAAIPISINSRIYDRERAHKLRFLVAIVETSSLSSGSSRKASASSSCSVFIMGI
jgi:hypothetical protein